MKRATVRIGFVVWRKTKREIFEIVRDAREKLRILQDKSGETVVTHPQLFGIKIEGEK